MQYKPKSSFLYVFASTAEKFSLVEQLSTSSNVLYDEELLHFCKPIDLNINASSYEHLTTLTNCLVVIQVPYSMLIQKNYTLGVVSFHVESVLLSLKKWVAFKII